jgi:hypothetical protein
MEIEAFIEKKYDWAQSPCLYIVKCMFEGNEAYRCGMAGGSLYNDADQPYNSETSLKGLYGRMTMYKNYWLPMVGRIFACLRIPAKLAGREDDRFGVDVNGNRYSIDHGSRTLVRLREEEMHREMDRRGLRWNEDKKNELFEPKKTVDELIACMRTIQSPLEMYTFDEGGANLDQRYRGGGRRKKDDTILLSERQTKGRKATQDTKAPVLDIRLSRNNIDLLRSNDPKKFNLLLDLVRGIKKTT